MKEVGLVIVPEQVMSVGVPSVEPDSVDFLIIVSVAELPPP